MMATESAEPQLLYETKFAIFSGRLIAMAVTSIPITPGYFKIRISSPNDVSILLDGTLDTQNHELLVLRFKNLLSSRSQDPSILGIRVDIVHGNVSFPFVLHVDDVSSNNPSSSISQPFSIPLAAASAQEFNVHLMQVYAKEKVLHQLQITKNDELAKKLATKTHEHDALLIRCEYQQKEIALLRQLTESQSNAERESRKKNCGCEEDMSCGSDCDGEMIEEDEDETELQLVRSTNGQIMLPSDPQNVEITSDGTHIGTRKIKESSMPDLMKQLEKVAGVIVKAPNSMNGQSTSGSIQVKLEETSEGSSSNREESGKQKEVVVGVVRYVICQLCPEDEQKPTDISNIAEMEAHFLDKHVDKDKKQCEACPTDQFQPHNIVQHMRIHTNSVYACQHCGKRGRKNYLRSHIRTHTGERPFQCDTCSKTFTDSSTLRRHRLVHTGEKKFQCPVCGRAIARKDNVKVHIRSHGISM